MFGPLAPGSKVEVGDFTVRLDESSDGSMLVYARLKGDSQESRILLSPSSRLRLLPSTPRLLPSPGIASCIMVELENPIVVSPGESVTSRITVPIDFVVESFTSDSKGSVVDVFHPLKAPKLALYGEPTEGFICRYWRTSIGGEASVGSASARLTVRNEWEKPGKVSLIVAPLPGLRIYYRPGSWEAYVSNITMAIEGASLAEVVLGDAGQAQGYEASPHYEPRRLPGVPPRFSMNWGY